MIISVHQPQYIPWLGYFDKIARSDAFVFLDCVQYKGREYQNRNRIRTKDGELWLTVPIITKGKGRQRIWDVLIDNVEPWKRQHLRSIEVSYSSCKFFPDYFPFFQEVYARPWQKLVDLNLCIIDYVLKQLSISTKIYYESKLDITSEKTDRIIEICKKLKADSYLSGAGGRVYLEEKKIVSSGIALEYQEYKHPAYRQRFMRDESDFIPCLSIIDLLFNEGPAARQILSGEKLENT